MASNCDFDSSVFAKYYMKEEDVPELNLQNTVTPGGLLYQLQIMFSEKKKLLSRTFVDISSDVVDDSLKFRVMQWNILAQGKTYISFILFACVFVMFVCAYII